MSIRRFVTLAAAAAWPLLPVAAFAQSRVEVSLNDGWQFRQHVDAAPAHSADASLAQWRAATVPGDVHLDLLHQHLIPDPFYGINEDKLQWIEKAAWEYRKTVDVTPAMLQHQHVELVFDGLDAACDVYLNGEKIASPDNMFRPWRLDVKDRLKQGANQLLVVFPPPLAAAEKVAAKDPWQPRIHTDPKAYIRKAVYEFGWDWGPRFVTSGIWLPVHLSLWDNARVDDLFIEQKDISPAIAHLDVRPSILASHAGPAQLVLSYGLNGVTEKLIRNVTLEPGMNHLDLPLEIAHPNLWYPAGYGAQPMYRFHLEVNVGNSVADTADRATGLRKVVLRRDRDQWGRSFEFDVNGIPVFARGADVIPFDSFPNRVTTRDLRRILDSAKDANMNMIRLWGGGYYQTEEFYELCDQLGLMVWQDLMFGNNWQPGTYDFKQQIEAEVTYQIRRLRNHPSIVLWCGNNETEIARDWGRADLPVDVRLRLWEDYLTEFSGILTRTANRLEPEIPYWPSSPSADYEDVSNDYQSGDVHDWNVWHGNADFSEYEQSHYRFVSEYGFQSFPEMKTVEAFTAPSDRTSIFTPVMLLHQKNSAGNQIIHDYMLRYFGEPKDFPSLLYASQILQAEGIKAGAEHFRRDRPRTMGSIFWQLNDCWPVASWSSIDYEGRWKALQYYARRFYAPVLVSPYIEDGKLIVSVVSDHLQPEQATLRLRVLHFDGTEVRSWEQPVSIHPLSSTSVLEIPLSEIQPKSGGPLDLTTVFAFAELSSGGHDLSSNFLYFARAKQMSLPEAKITASLAKSGAGYDLTLESPVLARSVFVSFSHADPELSDNFFDLLPGAPMHIHVASDTSLEALRSQLSVISLSDAFKPQAQQTQP